MKMLAIMLLPLFSSFLYASEPYYKVFENKSLIIVLESQCSPCDLACDKIHYQLFDKENNASFTGSAISLSTSPAHNFRGYQIDNGNTIYRITESDSEDTWDVSINTKTDKEKTIQITAIFNNGTC